MVVEDDAGMLRAIARAVEREGLPVVLFTNGDDALVYLRHSVPAAVLLDLSLPGGANGFDIIKALQATARLAMVPVFVVTGIDLTTAEEQWLIERTKDLVRKASMDFDTVMQAVVSAVEPAGSDCCLGRPAESKVFHALAQQKPEDDNTPRCAVAE